MAAADRTNNTEQLQRFINNLWQHQQKNEFCDFTLTTNNTSIECHKLVLSSASAYFSQLLCDSEHNTNIIDVTPLPEHILRTVVAFMYNNDNVINDENVIELLKFSGTWNLDILAKLCVEYMNDNITINNACTFYDFALYNVDQQKSQHIHEFMREHFTSLHESGQLSELSLKNFTTIIEHDEINVKNEDVIFSSAVQIINQQTSVGEINRCLELIRFSHMSGDFLVNVILHHPLMKEPPRDKYASDAIIYQINKTSTPEVKPPRYWGRTEKSGIYYIGKDHCMYQYVSKAGNNECVQMMSVHERVDDGSSVALHKERMVIVGGSRYNRGNDHVLLLDMKSNIKVKQLPDLPKALSFASIVLSDNDVYVVGGYSNFEHRELRSVYYLSLGSDAWQKKKLMPHRLTHPLVIKYQESIFVLGGDDSGHRSHVSQYNIEDDTWKQHSIMPVDCLSYEAGVVVHKNRIKVFTVDKCLIYDDDTDNWTVKRYTKLGNAIQPLVRGEQIYAAVTNKRKYANSDTHSMLSYDDVDNMWKTEHEKIDNAWNTMFFC